MNSLKTIDNRRLVPRWQSLKDAYDSREILPSKKAKSKEEVETSFAEEIACARNEWLKEKSLFSALEYLEKQRIGEVEYDTEALQFVKKAVSGNDQLPDAIRNFFVDEIGFTTEYSTPQIAIGNIRKQTILHPNDAYLWLELARNYLVIGLIEKSEKALLIARSLAPDDRYISRSMMRFYHHTQNIDKALYYVRRMKSLTSDPMILSGEIALCNTVGRPTQNIKQAKYMMQSQNFSPLSLSELTSEIATMEIMGGRERIGKRLLAQSLNTPTENALAQTTWINQCVMRIPWIQEINSLSVPNNFEGEIYLGLASKDKPIDWSHLFEQCKLWNAYQPFSRNPIYLAGNIATDFLEKYQEAFDFSLSALPNHKDEAGLLNNIAYAAILNGDKENAQNYLKLQLSKCGTDEEKVVYLATKGLYEFRFGEIALGKALYVNSFELASSINSKLYAKVLAYYYRELDRVGDNNEKEIVRQKIMKYKDFASDFILIQLMKKFKIIE